MPVGSPFLACMQRVEDQRKRLAEAAESIGGYDFASTNKWREECENRNTVSDFQK